MTRYSFVCIVCSVVGLPAATATATLIAYEPFAGLTNGDLVGQGSGFGWGDWNGELANDKWTLRANGAANHVTVESGALSYKDPDGNALRVEGAQKARAAGSANGSAVAFRPIAGAGLPPDIAPDFGTLRYIVRQLNAGSFYTSFLAKREGQTDAEWIGGPDPDNNPYSRNGHLTHFTRPSSEFQLVSPGEEAVIGNTFAVAEDNEWFFSGGSTQLGTGVAFGGGDQRFVVMKVTFGSGSGADNIEMWIDPSLESEAAANATNLAKVMGLFLDDGSAQFKGGAIGLAAGRGDANRAPGDIIFDEIRIGTTWESVAPIQIVEPPLSGDFNGDGEVNLADYTVWRDNLGAEDDVLAAGSTTDGSGFVDSGDYETWKQHFGTTAAIAAPGTTIPEPTAFVLVMLLMPTCYYTARLRERTNRNA